MEGSRTHRALAKIKDKAEDAFWFCFAYCVLLPLIWFDDRRDERIKKARNMNRLWEAVVEVEKKNHKEP